MPTFLSANSPAPVPVTVTTSLPNGPTAAVPVNVAVGVASYVLLCADMPLTASDLAVMPAVNPVG